jgi:hypothetical protein
MRFLFSIALGYSQQACGSNTPHAPESKSASRIGRGTRFDREERVRLWPVSEEYRHQLDRLNHSLLRAETSLLDATLCHELAHIVIYHRYGTAVAAHGEEWRALMRAAGYPATARMAGHGGKRKRIAKRYRHTCAVCQAQRLAGSPMINWRCGQCQSQGLDGILVI